jgi:hypothetical protein
MHVMSPEAATGPTAPAARPTRGRRLLALLVGLAGTFGAGVGLGLLGLGADRRYDTGWMVATGAVAAVGALMVVAAIWLARLTWRRALIALLGSLILVPPIVEIVRFNVGAATSYAPGKRTVSDLRSLGSAIESQGTDAGSYPPGTSLEALTPLLVPSYIQAVPTRDGWTNPLRYEATAEGFCLGSPGEDGRWDHEKLADYEPATGAPGGDIVFCDGKLVVAPRGS